MKFKMNLTPDEISILNEESGEILGKVMKTMVLYGDAFDADRFVDVSSNKGHLVTSFGLSVMGPVYDLMKQLIDAGVVSKQAFTVDPRPLDLKHVPSSFIDNIVFKIMYSKQDSYEEQLEKLGLAERHPFTCTSYMNEVGNVPKFGDVLSWAESSAVVYANSVIGARCNRNSGIIELFGSILGKVPRFGLLTDEGRLADYVINIETDKLPEAQLLGSAIGMRVMDKVPYITGLDKFLGDEMTQEVKDYLKDMGAATASNGAVGLYHIENITPEAKLHGRTLIHPDAIIFSIDQEILNKTKDDYPLIWKNKNSKPKLCFIGCPHLSYKQLVDWTDNLEQGLAKNGLNKVNIPTVLTAAVDVIDEFSKTDQFNKLEKMGVNISYICPLMYMNNPLCAKKAVITNSNKLRTYTTSRYYTDAEIVNILTRRRAA